MRLRDAAVRRRRRPAAAGRPPLAKHAPHRSGKHSGFLAWCRLHDAPTRNYVDPGHPLQHAIRALLADCVQMNEDQLPSRIDGCSAPSYALPLARLAHLYARLGGALGTLFDAMTGCPDMVSGAARTDLAWMTAGRGDWVAKIGADAVQAIGIRSRGLGIAIKVANGASRALHPATFAVLGQLGVLDGEQRELLDAYRAPVIRNARGTVAGEVRPVFTLKAGGAPLNP